MKAGSFWTRLFSFMGFRRAFLVALCILLVACGSDAPTTPTPSPAPAPSPVPAPSPTPPPAAAPPFTLSGRVTDLTTGAPLAVTSVTIVDGTDTGRTATTDATGAFQLADLGLGGRTVRFRHDGYDSVFRGVTLVSDTSVAIGMRPAMQSLAGTWTGSLTVTTSNTPTPQTTSIPELNMTHAGADISGVYPNTVVLFTGTLRNSSAIGATTEVMGTLVLNVFQGGRSIVTCTGRGAMSGTVNWTRLVIVAPQVPFDCGFTYTNVTVALLRQQ